MTCRLGYHFARIKGSDEITTVACWGDMVEKETPKDVEVLEQIPTKVIEHCRKGVKILNLQRIINGRCS